jgi:hypothetical protein
MEARTPNTASTIATIAPMPVSAAIKLNEPSQAAGEACGSSA